MKLRPTHVKRLSLVRYKALPFLLALFFVTILLTVVLVHAQSSISGDEVCGSGKVLGYDAQKKAIIDKCKITDIGPVIKKMLIFVLSLAIPLLIIFVTFRLVYAWFQAAQGNANAYKEAAKKSWEALKGFIFLVVLVGGFFTLALKLFGVQDDLLKLLQLFSYGMVEHAYAENTGLPNPLKYNDVYSLIMAALRLFLRFFVYPALICMWVITGFSFVAAQGNPEALTRAKKWLIGAFFVTLAVVLIQSFLVALQATAAKILPGTVTTSQQSTTGTLDGRGVVDGQAGAACTMPNGTTGQLGGADGKTCFAGRGGGTNYTGTVDTRGVTDGAPGSACTVNGTTGHLGGDGITCFVGRGAGSTNSTSYCTGKAIGTLCDIPVAGGIRAGTCSNNETGKYACYTATQGDSCISGNGDRKSVV